MDEENYLDACLQSIYSQTFRNYEVFICVNQPEAWWHDESKKHICQANMRTLKVLQNENCIVIDKASRGFGWDNKRHGVGWARKILMDSINKKAKSEDIIISLDADTICNPGYFAEVLKIFEKHPEAKALANPYYHKLTTDEKCNRAMLRYEIYMRCYALNLRYINSPYAFTALGSAIALPISVYRKIGGITPKKSGEDFYFLQKIRKAGEIATANNEAVFPATRFSDRVFFGTGPALIKGEKGLWQSYPIYHRKLFENIKKTYELFPSLRTQDIPTPLDSFLEKQFQEKNIWEKLRRNTKSPDSFINACHQKIDGLRILQYLKAENSKNNIKDEDALRDFLRHYYHDDMENIPLDISFSKSCLKELNLIRAFLAEKEKVFQQQSPLV